MNLNKLLASYTFRFTLYYITALSFSVFVVLGIVYAIYSYQYSNEVNEAISHELDLLDKAYTDSGIAGARQFVAKRVRHADLAPFFYLVVNPEHKPLAGNLDAWPNFRRYPQGWLSFELHFLQRGGSNDADNAFVGRTRVMPDGNKILVARPYGDVIGHIRLVAGFLLRGMIVTIVMGSIGGALISLLFLRRIEAINRSISHIMAGDLSKRIRIVKGGGDFEELVDNFNRLLDRIESLMEGMKQVTDNIAHDLRTPLTRLRNHLAELQQVGGPAEATVEKLVEEADGLLSTFNAMLRIARIESRDRRSGFADVDVVVILHDVVELYEPLASEKGQLLVPHVIGEVSLKGDRDLLFQACANLVDNAIKYTPDGGEIRVSARWDGGSIRIVVADNGPGIPQSEWQKAFGRFYRLETSRGELPGNGLGLSLVAAVVKLHNGSVMLEDNEPGLRVVITLPGVPG